MNHLTLLDASLLNFAVRWSLLLSFAVLLVLALRPWFRRFGAAASYGLWGLVPLAWLVSFVPGPSIESAAASDTLVWQQYLVFQMPQSVAESSAHAVNPMGLGWLWLSGALLMLSWRVFLHLRFIRRARAGLLERLAPNIDVRSVYSATVSLPFVSGLIRPKIYLPMDFETRFSSEHQDLMLAHERAHIAALDLWALALAEVLLALQWFNPLAYFARRRMQCDQEMACDARVLSSVATALAPSARLRYAELLQLSVTANPDFAKRAPDQRATSPMACLWPTQHPILERISMLKNSHVAPMYRKIALAISCVIAVAVSTLVWSANTSQSIVAAVPEAGISSGAVNASTKSAVMYKIATTMVFEGKTVNPIIGVIAGHQGSIAITDAKGNSTQPDLKFIVRPGTDAAHVAVKIEANIPFTPSSASDPNKMFLPNQPLGESIQLMLEGGTLTLMITETNAEDVRKQFSMPHIKSTPRAIAMLLAEQSGLKLVGAELLSDTQGTEIQMPGVPVKTVAALLADIDGLAVKVDAQQITFSAMPAQ